MSCENLCAQSVGDTRGYAGEADETERLRTGNGVRRGATVVGDSQNGKPNLFLAGIVRGRVWLGVRACARPGGEASFASTGGSPAGTEFVPGKERRECLRLISW